MLYIMRHGKTEWNSERRLQGRTDMPLSAEGRAMAAEAAQRYADTDFDICYCSPLARATETAKILLGGRGVPIITDGRLTEMGFGKYEGTGMGGQIPAPLERLFLSPADYVPEEGAESFEGLFKRTGQFLNEIVAPLLGEGKTVLIVGHGAMDASIICRIRGIPLEKFWSALTANCELVKLI